MAEPDPKPTHIQLSELMARKLEGLAYRVRMGQVIAFDLAWNVGQSRQDPTRFFGMVLLQAHNSDDIIDCLEEAPDESPEQIQRDVNKLLETQGIEVEDHTAVTGEIVVNDTDVAQAPSQEASEPEEDEDFHVIEVNEEPGDDDGGGNEDG